MSYIIKYYSFTQGISMRAITLLLASLLLIFAVSCTPSSSAKKTVDASAIKSSPAIDNKMIAPIIVNADNFINSSSTTSVLVTWTSNYSFFYIRALDITDNKIVSTNDFA